MQDHIFLAKDNAMIEVKSTFTLKKNWEKIRVTRQSCEALGYDFTLWVFGDRGQLLATNPDQQDRVVWKSLPSLPVATFAAPEELVDPYEWAKPSTRWCCACVRLCPKCV